MASTRLDAISRATGSRRLAICVVLGGLVLSGAAAVLAGVPVAAWLLAGLLVAVAGLRVLPGTAPVLAARSLAFDLAVLLTLAGVLAILAPAGLLD